MSGSIFVLFVDDDSAFADAAAHDLEGLGLRAVVALGSKAALDAFESNAFDVVITDAKLLGDEAYGLTMARMIRHKNPHVPVILMTAYPELLEGQVALPGAVLCRPLELAELCRDIKAGLTK